ncbi:rRNA adenine dimethyltransferase family protein [Saccharomonospora sp. NPDC006951]
MSSRKPSRAPRPNPSGVHFLTSHRIIDGLIRSCAPTPDDLVVEFGPGHGAITAPLTKTGAHVVAVERDPLFARGLRTRFDGKDNVRVVVADARTFPLPRKDFLVVASIPYSISSALLRRLLNPGGGTPRKAGLIVEWGFAKRLTTAVPRTAELAWWAARFDITLVRKVPAHCFRPVPSVDSAQLLIERKAPLGKAEGRTLRAILEAAYQSPQHGVRNVIAAATGTRSPRLTLAAGLTPTTRAGTVKPAQWARLAHLLTTGRPAHSPGRREP